MATDHELTQWIERALLLDERLSSQPIDVNVERGTARLTGTVPSYRRKLAAQSVAASFEGCRGVVNDLKVAPPDTVPDDDLAESVRSVLDAHADVTKETITVSVTAGVVTLGGNVASVHERAVAEDVALSLRGVRDVRNLLLVDLGEQIQDEALSLAIQDDLAHTRGLREMNVRVAVCGDAAVLSGQVPQLWQKEMAESVTRRFAVMTVRNELQVVGE